MKETMRESEKREMRENRRGKREGKGGEFLAGLPPLGRTPTLKIGFFWRFVRYSYSRKLIFFMGK